MTDNNSMKPSSIKIDDVEYVRKDEIKQLADKKDGMKYCVIRTYSAGVHIGYVKSFAEKHPQHCELINTRRLYSWTNACSLSQVAMDGVGEESRISVEVPENSLTDAIECIPCSAKAAEFFKSAKEWKK